MDELRSNAANREFRYDPRNMDELEKLFRDSELTSAQGGGGALKVLRSHMNEATRWTINVSDDFKW